MVGAHDGSELLPYSRNFFPARKSSSSPPWNDPEERAKILDLGADDYLGKPYSMTELLSRMRALFRRKHEGGKVAERSLIQIGDLEIFLLENRASIRGAPLELTPKEFRLLSILARDPGKVWSKYRLLDLVWQINLELESNVVEAMIATFAVSWSTPSARPGSKANGEWDTGLKRRFIIAISLFFIAASASVSFCSSIISSRKE